jgi:alkylation response protein AidB-like acyl-CoA dehydrogenase
VYLGIAEAARDIAVARTKSRPADDALCLMVGEMENELAGARLAHADMLAATAEANPGPETTNRVMTGRTLVARSVLRTAEKAMEIAGGASLYCDVGLERLFRDIQGARFHPLSEKPQQLYAGRMALGLPIDP